MRRFRAMALVVAAVVVCGAVLVYGHHAAEGIVDEEIYAMIDELVADTPHADIDFSDMGNSMVMTIDTRTTQQAEILFSDGLLTYAAMLDGTTSGTFTFDETGRTYIIITQER